MVKFNDVLQGIEFFYKDDLINEALKMYIESNK